MACVSSTWRRAQQQKLVARDGRQSAAVGPLWAPLLLHMLLLGRRGRGGEHVSLSVVWGLLVAVVRWAAAVAASGTVELLLLWWRGRGRRRGRGHRIHRLAQHPSCVPYLRCRCGVEPANGVGLAARATVAVEVRLGWSLGRGSWDAP